MQFCRQRGRQHVSTTNSQQITCSTSFRLCNDRLVTATPTHPQTQRSHKRQSVDEHKQRQRNDKAFGWAEEVSCQSVNSKPTGSYLNVLHAGLVFIVLTKQAKRTRYALCTVNDLMQALNLSSLSTMLLDKCGVSLKQDACMCVRLAANGREFLK